MTEELEQDKSKKKKDILTNLEDIDLLTKSLIKDYGDNVVVPANSIVDSKSYIVPISPRLDLVLNGGIPDGTWITPTGPAGCGKTTLALHYAAKCQRPEYGSREVFYLDVEGRLKKINLLGIPGLDLKKFHAIRSHKKKILSGQEFLRIAENILRAISHAVVIIDSYSALCHESELVGDVGMSTRGAGGYTLLSQFCRQMCNIVPVMQSNVIGITHLMANVGSPYGGFVEKSGTSLTFHADIRLKAVRVKTWEVAGKNRPIGQVVTWHCTKSALGGPGGEVESYIRYGKGIDELYELMQMAIDVGMIEVSARGGWHTFKFLQDKKLQGGDEAYQFISSNPEVKSKLIEGMKNYSL